LNKNVAVAAGQLAGFGALTLLGIKLLQPPKALPDPAALRRAEILKTAAARKFDAPVAIDLVRGIGFNSTKDSNAGALYLQALKATYAANVKPSFDRFAASSGPAGEAARRQAAAELFQSPPVKLLEQAVQMKQCTITLDQLPVKSLLDLKNSVELPAQMLSSYVAILDLKGDSYGQAGRRDFQKLYYQAGVTVGAHLVGDGSPAALLAGLDALVDSKDRLQKIGDPDAGKLDAAIGQLASAYPKTNLEDVLILAGDVPGMIAIENWIQQPSFMRAYGFWSILAALTQWSPEEFQLTGPSDGRRQFMQDMINSNVPAIQTLGRAGAKDLDTLAQKWATLPSTERPAFRKQVESIPLDLVGPYVRPLYGSDLELAPAPAKP
jgi:hypothetical protein